MRLLWPFAFTLCASVTAQTGPGGVGNSTSNILWLRADSGVLAPTFGVQQWTDMSGNGNHAAQTDGARQPLLATNVMNGMPAVLFDNDQTNADRLTIPDNATLEGMNGLTGFAVYRLNAGTATTAPRGLLSKRVDPGSQNAYGWFLWDSGGNVRQHLDINGTGERVTGTSNRVTATNYLDGFVYHGAAPSNANDQVLYAANAADGNRQETSTSIPNYTSDLHIGVLYGHTGAGTNTTRFNGHIAEVLLYNTALNTTQRTIVANYLAAKYGLALGTGDIYLQDAPGNGNYDRDVAGIGRTTSSDLHTASRGSGMVEIAKGTHAGLDDNEFLLWGHDNGVLGAYGSSDFPPTCEGRLGRVWRVSEVNASGTSVNVGNVDMTWDLTGLGAVVAAELCLLVDSDNDGFFADETPVTGAVNVSGNLYRFSGVSALQNNRRFTLGTTSMGTTPLPIELVSFTATAETRGIVRANWVTASEQDNERFTLERSTDLNDWTTVLELPGAGNSTATLSYEAYDREAPRRMVYYRLRQTDYDGTSTVSESVAVDLGIGWHEQPVVYPNPSTGPVVVILPEGAPAATGFDLIDALGRSTPVPFNAIGGGSYRMDVGDLPAGSYLLRVLSLAGEMGYAVRIQR